MNRAQRRAQVALLAEGVDRNTTGTLYFSDRYCRPPRGGRGLKFWMPSNCKSCAAKSCRTASTRANDRCIRKKRFPRAQPCVAPERTDGDNWDDYDTVFIGDSLW